MYLLRVVTKPKYTSHLPSKWKRVNGEIVATLTQDGPYWFENLKSKKFILHITLTNLVTQEILCYSSVTETNVS
jgi:hypothetical protein